MPAEDKDRLLELYARELTYLREQGRDFAQRHPRIAARLSLSAQQSADPHVERLIESFAFLTARLSRDLEDELPIVTASLLGALYPQLASPVPPMAIAAFTLDAAGRESTDGVAVAPATELFIEAQGGKATCRFRTTYPTTLWPFEVTDARFDEPDKIPLPPGEDRGDAAKALRIKLRSIGKPIEKLTVTRLRFYLADDRFNAAKLYDLLFSRDLRARVYAPSGGVGESIAARVEPVGFARDEGVLPYPENAHPGHRLVQEYFAFPEKFFFFDVVFDARPSGQEMEIGILLEEVPPASLAVSKDSFQLGCVPVVNLFRKSTEPIRLDQTTFEYRLIADVRRERFTEIHSILRVLSTKPGETQPRQYEPFFSYVHRSPEDEGPRAFWNARRAPAARRDVPGTDMFLSLVDLSFRPAAPADEVVYAETLCTNRDLAEELAEGARLQPERGGLAARCALVTKPTRQLPAPAGGEALWRLVSNLSLGHVSLADAAPASSTASGEALREALRAYLFTEDAAATLQIDGVKGVSLRPVSRRIRREAWRGFSTGTEITVVLEEKNFSGASPILFGAVLSRFFALQAHLDTFTQLVQKKAQDPQLPQKKALGPTESVDPTQEWRLWPLMAGEATLL